MKFNQAGLLVYAFPLMVLVGLMEAWVLHRRKSDQEVYHYDWKGSLASFGVAIGHKLSQVFTGGIAFSLIQWGWQHRLWTIPLNTAWGVAALFIATEFIYYWQHRFSHEVRWLWATHSVHHTPQQLNLSAAYRLGWTGVISGLVLFLLPLVMLGFSPRGVIVMLAINLLYQFWLHTELVPPLGWFDRLFNSPSNHRVHHASDIDYLDHNYGGVLIIFDRFFGTWTAEKMNEKIHYGIVNQAPDNRVLSIVFGEWVGMLRDAAHAQTWHDCLNYLFGRPGWQPDGQGKTTASLRSANRPASSVT